jgi:TM2 domain-containing membrane protein YozV/RNA polymerase subunit RPABC4/transcription elongation factor Spt4
MIKCNNCGDLMPDDARFCPNCGTKVEHEVYCRNCGKPMSPFDTVCPSCGTPVDSAGRDYGVNNELNGIFCNTPSGKNRGVAALLAIFLGTLGIHFFYIGKIGAGFVNLAISLLGSFIMVGPVVIGILSVIQGIRMLTMTPAEFDAHYVQSRDFYPF